MSRRPDKTDRWHAVELIDHLRRGVGAHLQAQRWTARERDAPEVSRPVDADEIATFARPYR